MAAAALVLTAGYTAVERPGIIRGLGTRVQKVLAGLRTGEPEGMLEASGTPAEPMGDLLSAAVETVYVETDSTGTNVTVFDPVSPAGPPEGIAPAPDSLDAIPETVPEEPPDDDPVEAEEIEEEPAPDVGLIDIHVEPEADIHIDGRWRGSTNRFGPVELPAGPHDITLSQRDFREYTERIVIRKGELSRRRIELQRILGGLEFATIAGASVFVNGKFSGTTPLPKPLQLPAGKYLVELKKHGYLTWTGEVDIPSSETLSLRINMIQRQ
jgi:hypothetical protein